MSPLTTLASAVAPVPRPWPSPAAPPAPRRGAGGLVAELHDLHAEELRRFCRWMLHDPDDAADAVQDTWIRAMAALEDGRLRVVAHRPWLYAIARNICLDRLRDRRRATLHEIEEKAMGDAPGADEVAAVRDEAAAALALVGSLPERQRSALLMRELAGMSMADIAQALGSTVDRAAWAVADARRALEVARAGSRLACEDIRDRLGSGHRSRALKTHLDGCEPCRAHDRRLRARRVLAPALFPLSALRRWGWAALAKPLAASAIVGLAALTLPVLPHRHPQPHSAAAPQPRSSAPVRRQAVRPPLRVAKGPRLAEAPRRAPVPAQHAAQAVPAPAPARAAIPAPAPVPAAAPTPVPAVTRAPRPVAGAVHGATAAVVRVVRRVAAGASATPTGPLAGRVTGVVDATLGPLG